MKNREFNKTVIGVFVASSIMLTAGAVQANPLTTSILETGYMQLALAEGKCGENKCGGKS